MDLILRPAAAADVEEAFSWYELQRFPYAVFYRVYPNAVVVVACMHGKRNPLRWRRRT